MTRLSDPDDNPDVPSEQDPLFDTSSGQRRTLRVLMVTPRFPPDVGGVERHVHEVSRRVAALGCDITVLCTDRAGVLPRRDMVDGVELRRVRAWPRRSDYYFAPGILRVMGEGHWDIVHVQSFHTFVAPIAMLRARVARIPYVLTFHGGGHSSSLRRSLRRVQHLALGPLVRRAVKLVAIARFEVPLYGGAYCVPADRFVYIPNGSNAPAEVGDPDTEIVTGPVIASIGRLERYKGHHKVLAAFPEVLSRRPDAAMWIVGSGPEEQALREQAASLHVDHRVTFRSTPSARPEAMAALMRATSLVVCLSDFESHPLVAVEAAAAGCSLLVAANSGLQELADDGWARAIPSDSTTQQVVEAILRGLDDPLVAPAIALPTWDDCARSLLDLYTELVSCES